MPKTFISTVALQEGFLKHLGNVATVLLDLVCLSLRCSFIFHTLCGALAVVSYIYIYIHDFSQYGPGNGDVMSDLTSE